jgi:serine/threonine protein phosphatase PrpC
MSNILPEKMPSPTLPDFIRSLVRELDAMHREGKVHGGLMGDVKTWLTDDANFAPEKFRAAAISTMGEGQAAADVADFMTRARLWVSGTTTSDHSAFKAANYSNEMLPISFLKLLENPEAVDSPPAAMSDFSDALCEAPAELPEPAPPAMPMPEMSPPPTVKSPPVPATDGIPISIALPNGTVGKPYEIEAGRIARAIAGQRKEDPERARIAHMQLPEDCGLIFDSATGSVSGVPTRSLDQQLLLDYTASPSSASISCKVSLFVNPDPASLWKDLPTSPDAPYQKESLDHMEIKCGHFRVVAASRRGRSHANRGDFRDDDFAIGHSDTNGWLVVAVADGAGSAKYSRKGSQIAATAARDRLVAVLSTPEYADLAPPKSPEGSEGAATPRKWLDTLLYETALHAHYKIREEVDQPSETLPEPATIRNYDTTLILLIMKKLDRGFFAATFSIGDGGAGILYGQDGAEALTHSDGGEHAGQTTFVTIASSLGNDAANIANRFKMTTAFDFTVALAMTDGITDPKFPSDAAFADPKCWHSMWDEIRPTVHDSASLLEWMNFFSPGNHDDRTLVAVLPYEESADQ